VRRQEIEHAHRTKHMEIASVQGGESKSESERQAERAGGREWERETGRGYG